MQSQKRTVSDKFAAVAVGFVVILIGAGIAKASAKNAITSQAFSIVRINAIVEAGVIRNNIGQANGIGHVEIGSEIIAAQEIGARADAEIGSEQSDIRTGDREISPISAIVDYLDTGIGRAQIGVVHPNLSSISVVKT